MSRIPLEDRKAYIASVPWVRRLKKKVACDGWMSPHGRRKCKNPAEWSYRRLRKAPGWGWLVHPSEPTWSHFCWSHLGSRGLYGNMSEEARWKRWQKKNPPPWRKNDDARRQGSEPEGGGEAREGSIPEPNGVQPNAEVGVDDGID